MKKNGRKLLFVVLHICFFAFVSSLSHLATGVFCEKAFCSCTDEAILGLSIILAVTACTFVVCCQAYVAKWHDAPKQTKLPLRKVLVFRTLFSLFAMLWACIFPILLKYDPKFSSPSCMVAGLLFCVALFPAVYDLLFCFTFRNLPNLFLSLAACVYYLIFLSFVVSPEELLGLGKGSAAVYFFLVEGELSNIFGWGILSSAVVAFVAEASKAVKYNFGGSTAEGTAQVNYRFKTQRLRLLSHRHHQNMILWIAAAYAVAFAVTFCMLLLGLKSGVALQLIGNLLFIAGGISLLGMALHYSISDSGMIQAERRYISYYAARQWPKSNDSYRLCKEATPDWSDYCQVCANYYCSYSGISSEDYGKHEQFETIKKISNDSSSLCCPVRILSDIVQTREKHKSLLFKGVLYTAEEELSADLMFSRQVKGFWESLSQNLAKGKIYASLHNLIKCAWNGLFSDDSQQLWVQAFAAEQLSYEELQKIIFLDLIQFLVQQRGDVGECRLAWLCNEKVRQNALLLEFPYIVKSVIEERWPQKRFLFEKDDGDSFFCKLAEMFYFHLYVQKINTYNVLTKTQELDECWRLFKGYASSAHYGADLLQRMFFPRCIIDSHNIMPDISVWKNACPSPRLTNSYLYSPQELAALYEYLQSPFDTNKPFRDPFWYITRVVFAYNPKIKLEEHDNEPK